MSLTKCTFWRVGVVVALLTFCTPSTTHADLGAALDVSAAVVVIMGTAAVPTAQLIDYSINRQRFYEGRRTWGIVSASIGAIGAGVSTWRFVHGFDRHYPGTDTTKLKALWGTALGLSVVDIGLGVYEIVKGSKKSVALRPYVSTDSGLSPGLSISRRW